MMAVLSFMMIALYYQVKTRKLVFGVNKVRTSNSISYLTIIDFTSSIN